MQHKISFDKAYDLHLKLHSHQVIKRHIIHTIRIKKLRKNLNIHHSVQIRFMFVSIQYN